MPEINIVSAKEDSKYYPYLGLFYANRQSFWLAGQDSFTLPPAQNSDLFQQLTNAEPVLQGTIRRRRGYTLLSAQSPSTPYTLGYSFRSELLGLRELVWTSPSNVLVTSEAGAVNVSPLFTPSAGASKPRMVLSRSFGYFADGIQADYKKWDGTQFPATGLTNWGIALNSASFGPNFAGSSADQGNGGTNGSQAGGNSTTTQDSVPGVSWTISTTNSVILGEGQNSTNLKYEGFGFSIPAGATIVGITASVNRSATGRDGTQIFDGGIFLLKAGSTVGADHSNFSSWFSSSNPTYGSSSDLWGTTWAPADINNAGFGLAVAAINAGTLNPGFNTTARNANPTITVYYTIPSAGSWSNIGNVTGACDGVVATAVASTSPTSDLRTGTFGFTTVSGAIVGIQVTIKASTSTAGVPINLNPILVKAGASIGTRKMQLVTSTGLASYTYGSPTDLWGASWLAGDINTITNFGVQFNASTVSSTATISVDCVSITIYTQSAPLTFTTNTSTTNIVLLSGRTYTYAFQNSKTGHVSTVGAFSVTTGPLVGNQVNLSGIPTPADTQADTVLILATADGNDETTLYLVGTVPSGTATFNDTLSDPVLQTQSLYQYTDSTGILHGIINNLPPVAINFPTKHKGRIYGAIGQTLFFSKNLAEVTTANGLITSKWEEAWPAVNTFDISELAETIQGIISDGETLWIGTERAVRRLVGDSPQNFQLPEIQFNEAGVLNQDSWKVVFFEDQPVGTTWLTPDFRVIGSDFNTYRDIGGPIQDVLNSINTAAVSTIHANFVSKGPADYYMLYLPTGMATTPNTICVYNLRTQKWFIWQPTDSPTASLFYINTAGIPQWTFATNAGNLYYWDDSQFQDRVGVSGVSYPVTAITSWLDLGNGGLRKALNQMIITTDDGGLTLGVNGVLSASESQFNTPDVVIAPTQISLGPLGENFVGLAGANTRHKYFQFTFSSPSSSIANVLAGFSAECAPLLRY